VRCELREEWKVDNFFCSHGCTSGATLVRGVSVLDTSARPALFLLGLLTGSSVDPFAPIIRFLVLLDFGNFCG
jgi:hypothetical protein